MPGFLRENEIGVEESGTLSIPANIGAYRPYLLLGAFPIATLIPTPAPIAN